MQPKSWLIKKDLLFSSTRVQQWRQKGAITMRHNEREASNEVTNPLQSRHTSRASEGLGSESKSDLPEIGGSRAKTELTGSQAQGCLVFFGREGEEAFPGEIGPPKLRKGTRRHCCTWVSLSRAALVFQYLNFQLVWEKPAVSSVGVANSPRNPVDVDVSVWLFIHDRQQTRKTMEWRVQTSRQISEPVVSGTDEAMLAKRDGGRANVEILFASGFMRQRCGLVAGRR
jgi:hypothetical protein